MAKHPEKHVTGHKTGHNTKSKLGKLVGGVKKTKKVASRPFK